MEPRTKGRLQLIGLAVLFIGPLVLAFWLYFGTDWRPAGQAVHGELITPPIELPNNPLPETGQPNMRDVWSVIVVASADCSEACKKALYETRQFRRALGKDRDRVQRIWIVENGVPDAEFVATEHPGLIVVDSKAGVGTDLISKIDPDSEVDIFVVDPFGNLMMRFPADLGMRGMHTDMKKLLKLSKIG